MPRRDEFKRMEHLTLQERRRQPDECQLDWYEFACKWVYSRTVLDVGAGSGYGLKVFRNHGARRVLGIDPLPFTEDVESGDICEIPAKSYDVVTAMDVIEHVDDDKEFLSELLRVARLYVFFSTPNYNFSKCVNEFHLREYTPEELGYLLMGLDCNIYSKDDFRKITKINFANEAGGNFGVLIKCADSLLQ